MTFAIRFMPQAAAGEIPTPACAGGSHYDNTPLSKRFGRGWFIYSTTLRTLYRALINAQFCWNGRIRFQ